MGIKDVAGISQHQPPTLMTKESRAQVVFEAMDAFRQRRLRAAELLCGK
jgi:hypothetical protein